MDKIKKQALEAAGWKFGDAEDFLNEGGMMDADKMRAEFEAWAKSVGHDLSQTKDDDRYWFVSTESAWQVWQAAWIAGRMSKQREAAEWSKRVNKRWIEMQNKLEGEQ